jgi:hypothetical protein
MYNPNSLTGIRLQWARILGEKPLRWPPIGKHTKNTWHEKKI